MQPKVKSAAGYSKADSYNNETYVQLGAKSKCLKRQPCGKYVFEKGNLLVNPRDLSISWHVCKIARHVFVVQVFFNDFPPTKKWLEPISSLRGSSLWGVPSSTWDEASSGCTTSAEVTPKSVGSLVTKSSRNARKFQV